MIVRALDSGIRLTHFRTTFANRSTLTTITKESYMEISTTVCWQLSIISTPHAFSYSLLQVTASTISDSRSCARET
jgi:hypothetical protein